MIERYLLEYFLAGLLLLNTFYVTIKTHKKNIPFNLVIICEIFISLTFGLLPFIIFIYGADLIPYAESAVGKAYIGIFLFIMGLKMINYLFFHLYNWKDMYFQYDYLLKSTSLIKTREVAISYSLFMIIKFIYAYNYNIFFSGSANFERILELPYYLVVVSNLLNIIALGCVVWAILKVFEPNQKSLLPYFILLLEFLFALVSGRRSVLFILLLLVILYFFKYQKFKLKYLLYVSFIILVFNLLISPFFLAFRQIYLHNISDQMISDFIYSYQITLQNNIGYEDYGSNLATRGYIIGWSIDILDKIGFENGFGGKILLSTFFIAVPNFLLENKYFMINPEDLINLIIGRDIIDSPSYWAAYGFADFGIIGGLIYGLFLGLILVLVHYIIRKTRYSFPLVSLAIWGTYLKLLIWVEESPAFYFSSLRDSLLIIFLFFFLYKLTKRNVLIHQKSKIYKQNAKKN